MDDAFIVAVSTGIFVLITVIAIAVSFSQRLQTAQDWEQFASRTGLTLTRGGMFNSHHVNGEVRHRQADLTTYEVRAGRSSITYTRFSVSAANPSGAKLTLEPAGFLSKLGESMGMKDEKIGSDDFDSRFNIHCTPPEYASMLLGGDPMIQGSISQIYDKAFKLTLAGGSLMFTRRGVERDVLALERILNTLCDIAEKIDGSKRSSF
jgi:hypothetical protein